MGLPRFGNRIVDVFGGRITDLVGGTLSDVNFRFGNTHGFAGSGDQGTNTVTVNREWWQNASRRDKTGFLVHELSHVAGVGGTMGANWADNKAEQTADAVRFALTGKYGINPDTLSEARRIANKRGWTDMANSGPGMPGLGSHGGRMRNTFANVLSKNKVDYQNPGGSQALPALSPAQNANYYSQLSGLYAGYQNQIDALKQQRLGIRAGYRESVAGTRAQEVSDLSTAQNQAIERGIAGSSADSQAQIGVRAGATSAIASAAQQKLMGLAQTQVQQQQAGVQYFMGAQGLEQQKLADQQTALAQQLQNNLIISGQETQMDFLRAYYNSLTNPNRTGGGGGGGGQPGTRPYPPPYAPSTSGPGKRLV